LASEKKLRDRLLRQYRLNIKEHDKAKQKLLQAASLSNEESQQKDLMKSLQQVNYQRYLIQQEYQDFILLVGNTDEMPKSILDKKSLVNDFLSKYPESFSRYFLLDKLVYETFCEELDELYLSDVDFSLSTVESLYKGELGKLERKGYQTLMKLKVDFLFDEFTSNF